MQLIHDATRPNFELFSDLFWTTIVNFNLEAVSKLSIGCGISG